MLKKIIDTVRKVIQIIMVLDEILDLLQEKGLVSDLQNRRLTKKIKE